MPGLLHVMVGSSVYVFHLWWETLSVVKSKKQCQGDKTPFSLKQKVKNKAIASI